MYTDPQHWTILLQTVYHPRYGYICVFYHMQTPGVPPLPPSTPHSTPPLPPHLSLGPYWIPDWFTHCSNSSPKIPTIAPQSHGGGGGGDQISQLAFRLHSTQYSSSGFHSKHSYTYTVLKHPVIVPLRYGSTDPRQWDEITYLKMWVFCNNLIIWKCGCSVISDINPPTVPTKAACIWLLSRHNK